MTAGYNGSGTYVLGYNFVTEAASPPIEISKLKAEFDALAVGLSTVICRDGQSTVSANLPMNAKKITGLADATADTDALNRQTADARYVLASTIETKYKASDETVNDSNTLQDDDDLASFTIAAATIYQIEGLFRVNNEANGGFKFALTTDQTKQWSSVGAKLNGSVATDEIDTDYTTAAALQFTGNGSTGVNLIRVWGLFLSHATVAGTLKLQWAQYAATVQDTKLLTGSFIRLTALGTA